MLDGPPVAYGKAAIVGVSGEVEHAVAGTPIDVPLCNKDNIWSFDELDTMTVFVPDAPRPEEIVVVMVVADRSRPAARVGKGRATT